MGTIELIGDKKSIEKLLEKFIDPESNSFQSKRYIDKYYFFISKVLIF
jgi:hypothetical protein